MAPAGDCAWRGWARAPSATTNSQRFDRSDRLTKTAPPDGILSAAPHAPLRSHPHHTRVRLAEDEARIRNLSSEKGSHQLSAISHQLSGISHHPSAISHQLRCLDPFAES